MAAERSRQILSEVLAGHHDGTTLPRVLCELCAQMLPVTGAGLALLTAEEHGGVVAATDGAAQTLEDLQFTLGEGPCLDASREGYPVLQPDLAATGPPRWPAFTPEALDAGVAAIFAYPLHVGWVRLGVLDLYRDTPGNLDNAQLAEALAFADAALGLLLDMQELTPPEEEMHPGMADPIGHRPEVHQATGMIAVQATVGMAEALLLLRGHAFGSGRPLLDVARDVVARRLRFDDSGERS